MCKIFKEKILFQDCSLLWPVLVMVSATKTGSWLMDTKSEVLGYQFTNTLPFCYSSSELESLVCASDLLSKPFIRRKLLLSTNCGTESCSKGSKLSLRVKCTVLTKKIILFVISINSKLTKVITIDITPFRYFNTVFTFRF